MQLEEFLEFLDEHGVSYHTTHGSIVLKTCPACGSEKNKVWLYKDRKEDSGPFFGKCLKCDEKWNSRSYLLALDIPLRAVNRLHGFVAPEQLNLSILPAIDLLGAQTPAVAPPMPDVPPVSIADYFPIDTWTDHPAAKYAMKRGWTPEHSHHIMLDHMSSAVVFVVRDGDKVVGFQKRYLYPLDPSRKTLSSPGFQRRRFVMEFPNNGDICVCEGPFTALSAWHYGYYAICTFGSNVGEAQIDKIASLAAQTGKSVAVAFDLDDAGRKGYRRVSLSMLGRAHRTYRIRPEHGNDLNDAWQAGAGVVVMPENAEDLSIPDLCLPWAQ